MILQQTILKDLWLKRLRKNSALAAASTFTILKEALEEVVHLILKAGGDKKDFYILR